MAKDKLNNIKNSIKKTFSFGFKAIDKLIEKVDLLDPKENTKQRVFSALILIPVALYAVFYSKSFFIFLAIAIAILMTSEWLEIIKTAPDQKKWRIIGFFYILIPIYSVIKIRLFDSHILFWMFSIIWVTDIFAFFAGRILGGVKLAPKISPNKTWSGLAGGLIASMIIGFLSSLMFSGGVLFFVVASVFLAALEQASDLLESKFKRIFGVKDSGNIIPGHGGVLDRLDGMMLVAPAVLILITIFSKKFGV
jgi:phosphatidate cytidylyltransferase